MQNAIIFLIGFMGSGKTTFGQQLSQALDYAFIDMDAYIEKRAKMTVPQIFSTKGEAYFRRLETEAIEELKKQNQCVVATGGGAPCFNDNLKRMNNIGRTVYLQLSPEKLAHRLSLDSAERPVLEGKSGKDLLQHVTQKLKEREPFYRQAHDVIDADKPKELLSLL